MRVGIEWSGHAYDMSFLSGAKLTLSHVVDASALAAAVAWWGRLRAALLLAAPTPDALLQAWRDTSETLPSPHTPSRRTFTRPAPHRCRPPATKSRRCVASCAHCRRRRGERTSWGRAGASAASGAPPRCPAVR